MTRPRSLSSSRLRLARQRARRPEGGRGRRVALVTGAARGIGAATVRRLAAESWFVVAVDRCDDDPRLPYALATPTELRELASARVLPVEADATSATALGAAVEDAERRWGGLDAVIAAAGVIAGGVPAWELDADQERAVLDVNLSGVLTAVRVGIPALLRRPTPRDGRFLAVASAIPPGGPLRLAAYGAAAAGVLALIRALAAELAGTGITANAVSPGFTRTALLGEAARLHDLPSVDALAAHQTLERLVEPDEVAGLLAWLAGPQGRSTTGGVFPLGGGPAPS